MRLVNIIFSALSFWLVFGAARLLKINRRLLYLLQEQQKLITALQQPQKIVIEFQQACPDHPTERTKMRNPIN